MEMIKWSTHPSGCAFYHTELKDSELGPIEQGFMRNLCDVLVSRVHPSQIVMASPGSDGHRAYTLLHGATMVE
jgi:hypothetical protein